jgi:predicted nucleic acid-binding Zn ribbon protein
MNEFKRNSNEAPLSEIIEKLMRAYGLENKLKEYDLIAAWPELMGPAVASRTTEIRIQNRVLILKLDSSVMRDELQHGKQIILHRLNEKAGCQMIDDIWFG